MQSSKAAVIGIDLGNQYFKSTLVKPGSPFTIVENIASKRKTPTAVGFTSEQRVYSLDAIMQSSSNPVNTFTYVLKLLGMEYNDANLEFLRTKLYNLNNLVRDERGYIAFSVDLKSKGEVVETKIFTVEEIIAIILSHAKMLAEKQAKGSVKNVYLTVPHEYSMNQRRMLVDAVEMADLTCIGMIEENSAAAVTYGVDRKDEEQNHTVLFLNLGSSDFEASVVNYFAEKENKTDKYGNVKVGDLVENIEILSYASSSEISGRFFDSEIVNILAETFNSMKGRENKPDIRENPRIVNRLFKEVKKIKETLSANKEVIVNLPEVADYQNLKMTLTRELFEERIEKYLIHLKTTVEEALSKANIEVKDLASVEIIGGALRVPKVKEYLDSLLEGQILSSHINGDEAMSFGAAFLGANSSSTFIVRKLFLHHLLDEPIMLSIEPTNLKQEDEGYFKKDFMFWNETDKYDLRKKYTVETDDNITVKFYTKSKGTIHEIDFTGVWEILASEGYKNSTGLPKVTFFAYMSANGYIQIEKVGGKYTEEYQKEVQKRVKVNTTNTSDEVETSDESNKTVDTEQTTESETSTEENVEIETDSDEQTETKAETKSKPEEPKYETITEVVTKTRIINMPINYTETFIGHTPLSFDEKINAISNLVSLEKRDKLILDTFKAKNDFEALIYSSRDWISNEDNHVYTTSDKIEQFTSDLMAAEDWLYEDGFDETLEVYKNKINEINSTITPMIFRKDEHELREGLIAGTLELLSNFTSASQQLIKNVPWVNERALQRLESLAVNTTDWIVEMIEKQKELKLSDDPILLTSEVREKIYRIGYTLESLARTPKPKDWDKKIKAAAEAAANSTDTSQNQTTSEPETASKSTTESTSSDSSESSNAEEDSPNSDL